MPGPHRRFLEEVSKIANIREFLVSHPQNLALKQAYNTCLEQLVLYRKKHLQIVSRYIVVPSRAYTQPAQNQTEPGTAGRVPAANDELSTRPTLGTGGTAPVEFLKQVKDETKESVLPALERSGW